MNEKPVRSQEARASFAAYLDAHPDERFWQAVRNWSGYAFILATDRMPPRGDEMTDTFYWEGRRD